MNMAPTVEPPAREITLSVITPTAGRDTLSRMMASLTSQRLVEGDQFIVVSDGPNEAVRQFVEDHGPPWEYLEGPQTGDWGNSQRNFAIPAATADYLVWMDDDDIFAADAFTHIREAARSNFGKPLMFKFRRPEGLHPQILWEEKILERGLIGGHCFVAPNIPDKLGRWSNDYTGDFDFISSTLEFYSRKSIVWVDQLIAICRPGDGD